MFAQIIEDIGETVTVVRLSADKDEVSVIANEIVCLIDPAEDHEHWKASLNGANRDISKGDILRRGDGSELQVLRSDTQSDPAGEEITELDLKDYDRAEQPLQKDEVNASQDNPLPIPQLHPILLQTKLWTILRILV